MPRNLKRMLFLGLHILLLSACASSPENKNEHTADVYLQLGVRYLSMNKLDIAKENLEHALRLDSRNAQAHDALAFLLEKINMLDDARAHYQTALSLAPDDYSIQNNFGRFLCERGDYAQGAALLQQSLSNPLNNQPWLAYTNFGRCLLGMKQVQQGEDNFRQALQLNAGYAPALLEMQKLSYQKGELWAAKGFLQRYLAVASHTAQTLWLALQIERALGNLAKSEEYKKQLLESFPLSPEAQKIKSALP
jgi:type IV pilus assembly protein PilF